MIPWKRVYWFSILGMLMFATEVLLITSKIEQFFAGSLVCWLLVYAIEEGYTG